MYAMVRWDRVVDEVRGHEVANRITTQLVPILRQIEGYRDCYVVAGDDGAIICIALFTDQAGVDLAHREAADWLAVQLSALLDQSATILRGRVWEGWQDARLP